MCVIVNMEKILCKYIVIIENNVDKSTNIHVCVCVCVCVHVFCNNLKKSSCFCLP